MKTRNGHAFTRAPALILAAGVALVATSASAHDPAAPAPPTHEVGKEHGSLSEISHKLSDPTSNMWALFTEFDLSFSDGDVNTGDSKVGGDMNFQPVLPIPLYGEGKDQWKVIARPSFPVIFSNPVPKGFNRFENPGGLGDTILPLPLVPPDGKLAAGSRTHLPVPHRHQGRVRPGAVRDRARRNLGMEKQAHHAWHLPPVLLQGRLDRRSGRQARCEFRRAPVLRILACPTHGRWA
jgi:hypothetical protein